MVKINQKILSADKKTVAVGPGDRWKEVYDYLTSYNLAAVGGRVSGLESYQNYCMSN